MCQQAEWKVPRGTDDRFMKDLGAQFQPVMAAVFVLRGKPTPRLGCGKSEALSMASASATGQDHVDARDEAVELTHVVGQELARRVDGHLAIVGDEGRRGLDVGLAFISGELQKARMLRRCCWATAPTSHNSTAESP